MVGSIESFKLMLMEELKERSTKGCVNGELNGPVHLVAEENFMDPFPQAKYEDYYKPPWATSPQAEERHKQISTQIGRAVKGGTLGGGEARGL